MARLNLDGITIELSEAEVAVLCALAAEGPWRFDNLVVPLLLKQRFTDVHATLGRLRDLGLVRFEFYFTGAVAEFSVSEIGLAVTERLASTHLP